MQIVTLSMKEIKPYKNNPRNNLPAIDAVAESIKQNGYRARIIVDENYEIIAGHTRYLALKKLGYKEVEVQMETDMSEEQKKKYRLLDNKTNEYAEWDFEKLRKEVENLDFGGFDFGFDMESLDRLKYQEDAEPVYSPDGVRTEVPDSDDPYLPDGYDDDEIKDYTDRQEDYVVKKRIIITYLPEQESMLASILGLDPSVPLAKVVYDVDELSQ